MNELVCCYIWSCYSALKCSLCLSVIFMCVWLKNKIEKVINRAPQLFICIFFPPKCWHRFLSSIKYIYFLSLSLLICTMNQPFAVLVIVTRILLPYSNNVGQNRFCFSIQICAWALPYWWIMCDERLLRKPDYSWIHPLLSFLWLCVDLRCGMVGACDKS